MVTKSNVKSSFHELETENRFEEMGVFYYYNSSLQRYDFPTDRFDIIFMTEHYRDCKQEYSEVSNKINNLVSHLIDFGFKASYKSYEFSKENPFMVVSVKKNIKKFESMKYLKYFEGSRFPNEAEDIRNIIID